MDSCFEGSSALIVDSDRDRLGQLRGQLSLLGIASVASATSANMATSYLAMQSFDFCFIAYDLGRSGKTGLQVIEEATFGGARRHRDAFVLITVGGQSQLAGALEYAPDACIEMPRDQLRLRGCLEPMVRIKRQLASLEELFDAGDWQAVLEQAAPLPLSDPDAGQALERLKGLALLRLERFQDAEALFASLAQQADWADIGLGLALYHQGRYVEARACLALLTGQNRIAPEAFLLQARCERILGRWNEAQLLLRKAVLLQPAAPRLQADLANLLALVDDWQQAVTAYREAVRHGRASVFQREECYYGLVESLLQQVDSSHSEASVAAESECVRTLEEAVRDFDGDPVVLFRTRLLSARLYQRSGNVAMAEQAARDAVERYGRLSPSEQALLADQLADGLEASLQAETARQCRQTALRGLAGLDWGRSNLAGMQSFRQQAFEEAYRHFCEAERLRDGNPAVVLNLVQAGLEIVRQQPKRAQEVLVHCDERLYRTMLGGLSHRQQARYVGLCQRLAQMSRAQLAAADGKAG